MAHNNRWSVLYYFVLILTGNQTRENVAQIEQISMLNDKLNNKYFIIGIYSRLNAFNCKYQYW